MKQPSRKLTRKAEYEGTALAGYTLSATMLRLLKAKGVVDQEDIQHVLGDLLVNLERDPLVSDPAVHAAREVLSSLASELGVEMKAPN